MLESYSNTPSRLDRKTDSLKNNTTFSARWILVQGGFIVSAGKTEHDLLAVNTTN